MTTTETNPDLIFANARLMHTATLDRMAAGDIRNAAEKAWCATLRATEALVLAHTGQPPTTSTAAGRRLRFLAETDSSLENLSLRYSHRQAVLHGECFYHEYCQPVVTERLIRETPDYIRDAESLVRS